MENETVFNLLVMFADIKIFIENRDKNQHDHYQHNNPYYILSSKFLLDFRIFYILTGLILIIYLDPVLLLLNLEQFHNSNYPYNSDYLR